jgi:hypothetical protein
MKNKLNKSFIILTMAMFFSMIMFNFISAEEVNYSVDYSYGGIQLASLKYEPYPANPGEYIDVWIKATIGSSVDYAKFELIEDFPFSLDSNEDPVREYKDFSGNVIIHYKVRVDKDAVEGTNNLKIEVTSSRYSDTSSVYSLNIEVANAQTDFDLVVQDSTTSEVSLAIANIGKNTANSMIVRIPEQDSFKVTGKNGQMVGNLESGDYTVTSFSLVSVGRNLGNLMVRIDYTDNIGERRSVLKEVQFNSQSSSANMTGVFPGSASGNFARGDFPNTSQNKNLKWYIMTGVLVLILLGFFIYSKNTKKFKEFFKNLHKKHSREDNSGMPEWIKKVKEKERK